MKRLLSIGIILLFIGLSISSSTGFSTDQSVQPISSGNTLYVGGSGPGNYTKIQDAIDDASEGDTVFVYNGTYYENVFVDKSINLIGEDRDITIIGGNFIESVVHILSDNIHISEFTIQNSGDEWYDAGIDIRANNNTIIGNNIISNNCWGILLFESNSNYITNNTISNNKEGIIYLNSSNNTIIGNYISNNRCGIQFDSSINNTIRGNNISNNDGFGIYLIHCHNNKIIDNNINKNEYYGIFLDKDSRFNSITNNNIKSNSRHGIRVIESINNNITLNNLISNKWDGIYLYLSKNNTIIFNNIVSNTDFGICLDGYSNYNTIINNTILESGFYGICISYSSSNIIISNIISDNDYGIWFYNSSYNKIIAANNISNNKHGIYLNSSNSNRIYHNNFINNTQNADDNGNNIWDDGYPSGGNYWDDYTGEDKDGDGIGDTPYPIPGGDNEDRYPLMKPWNSSNNAPYGPIKGFPGINYIFYYDLPVHPEGDYYYVMWNWGDDNFSEWMGPYAEVTISAHHFWTEPGKYDIRVKLKDSLGERNWSLTFTITVIPPAFEIKNIMGGLFKVKTTIKNNAEITAPDVHWRITLEGGIILIGRVTSGVIPDIPSGEEVNISSGLIVGFGAVKIIVEVWIGDEPPEVSEYSGFVLLFFIQINPGGLI